MVTVIDCWNRTTGRKPNGGSELNGGSRQEKTMKGSQPMNDTNDGLSDLYARYLEFADLMAVDHTAFEIAGVMMAQAMSMYKTVLDQTDYDRMVDSIGHMRNHVKSFNTQQGTNH